MRIALVNDMRLAVEALRRVVDSMPDARVAWIAEDGQQAIDLCRADRPDLILMDLIMPNIDGVEATGRIMREAPCPILVVTATVTGNCSKVYEALGHGAVDAVNTPVLGRDGSLTGGDELVRKIRTVRRLQCCAAMQAAVAPIAPTAAPGPASTIHGPLVAIGASTGGPQALEKVLVTLHRPLGYSIVVVQHLDPLFVPGMAEWLSHESGLDVRLIRDGDRPTAGTVHLASTSDHLVINRGGHFAYVQEPKQHVYRPSVDVFFTSLLQTSVAGVAVLLTGMGRDGATGLKSLQEAGWKTIAQDQETSIVWGMPGAAASLGAADQILPIERIGSAMTDAVRSLSVARESSS